METVNYKGFEINIYQDDIGINPRNDYSNGGTMVCFHSRYNLGDDGHGFSQGDYNSWDELADDIVENHGALAILPLRLYDHGGISMSVGASSYPFNCEWDSMWVGFIFIDSEGCDKIGYTEEWAKQYYPDKTFPEALEEVLKAEVKEYNKFISEGCYLFQIPETDDCCGGFLGYDHEESGLLEHAKDSIDAEISNRVKERVEKVKAYIKSNVPFIYRELPELA